MSNTTATYRLSSQLSLCGSCRDACQRPFIFHLDRVSDVSASATLDTNQRYALAVNNDPYSALMIALSLSLQQLKKNRCVVFWTDNHEVLTAPFCRAIIKAYPTLFIPLVGEREADLPEVARNSARCPLVVALSVDDAKKYAVARLARISSRRSPFILIANRMDLVPEFMFVDPAFMLFADVTKDDRARIPSILNKAQLIILDQLGLFAGRRRGVMSLLCSKTYGSGIVCFGEGDKYK